MTEIIYHRWEFEVLENKFSKCAWLPPFRTTSILVYSNVIVFTIPLGKNPAHIMTSGNLAQSKPLLSNERSMNGVDIQRNVNILCVTLKVCTVIVSAEQLTSLGKFC